MSAFLYLTDAKIGINQYQDGGGFEFEVALDDEGSILVSQQGDTVSASLADWERIHDAILKIAHFRTEVSK